MATSLHEKKIICNPMVPLLLALVCSGRPPRPMPDLTDEQYKFVREADFFGHRTFLLASSMPNTLFLLLGFAVLAVVRNLPISMAALSMLLFLASQSRNRLITHASSVLVMSIVMLSSDIVMAISAIVQGIAPILPLWPSFIDASRVPVLSWLPQGILGSRNLGGLLVVNALLILACFSMLSRIKGITTRFFYLRESYRFYVILGLARCIVLFHSLPLSGDGKLALKAQETFLVETLLYILICCAMHLILVSSSSAKSVSIEEE